MPGRDPSSSSSRARTPPSWTSRSSTRWRSPPTPPGAAGWSAPGSPPTSPSSPTSNTPPSPPVSGARWPATLGVSLPPRSSTHRPAPIGGLVLRLREDLVHRRRLSRRRAGARRPARRTCSSSSCSRKLDRRPIVQPHDIEGQLGRAGRRLDDLDRGRDALRARPGQEGAGRRHGGAELADVAFATDGTWPAFGSPGSARSPSAADLLRLLRLLGHGHRPGPHHGVPADGELLPALLRRLASASSGGVAHDSLSTWFRDYLYLPLGGNRGPVYASTSTC